MDEIIRIFDDSIQKIDSGESTLEEIMGQYADNPELLLLLATWQKAKQGGKLSPSTSFRKESRARLKNRIRHISPSVTNSDAVRPIGQKPKKNRRSRMTWIAIALTALTLFVGGTTATSASESLPGDTLYPLKTGFQQIQLEFSDDEGDVDLLLGFMNSNIAEIDRLMQLGRADDVEVGLQQYNMHLTGLEETQNRINYDTQQPDDALTERIQEQLKTQTQLMQQLCDQTLEEPVKQQLQQSIHNAEAGMGYGPEESGPPETEGEPSGNGPGEEQGETRQNEEGKPEDAGPPDGAGDGTPDGPNGQNEDPGTPKGPGEPQGTSEPGSNPGNEGGNGQGQQGGGK